MERWIVGCLGDGTGEMVVRAYYDTQQAPPQRDVPTRFDVKVTIRRPGQVPVTKSIPLINNASQSVVVAPGTPCP